MPAPETPADVNFEFFRSYGVHRVELPETSPVTIVSAPTWRAMGEPLYQVRGHEGYVLTPEAITVSPEPLNGDLSHVHHEIRSRNRVAAMLSRQMQATLVLGTLVFDNWQPYNAQLAWRDGVETARTYKVYEPDEDGAANLIQGAQPQEPGRPAEDVAMLICFDLLYHARRGNPAALPGVDTSQYVSPFEGIRTLLVSSVWATVRMTDRPEEEEHFMGPLRHAVGILFARHAMLQTVIGADRLPADSSLSGPFNFVARRA
jgi:hypothetical protein